MSETSATCHTTYYRTTEYASAIRQVWLLWRRTTTLVSRLVRCWVTGEENARLTVDELLGDEFPVRLFFDTECVFINSLLFLENIFHSVEVEPFAYSVLERSQWVSESPCPPPWSPGALLFLVSLMQLVHPERARVCVRARVHCLRALLLSHTHFPAAPHHSWDTSALPSLLSFLFQTQVAHACLIGRTVWLAV